MNSIEENNRKSTGRLEKERAAVTASTVGLLPNELLATALAGIVSKGFSRLGVRPAKEDMSFIIREVFQALRTKYNTLYIEEVETVIERGITNVYSKKKNGEIERPVVTLTSAEILTWLYLYCNESGDAHRAFVASKRAKILEASRTLTEKSTMTDEERATAARQSDIEVLRRDYQKYCNNPVDARKIRLINVEMPIWDFDRTPFAGTRAKIMRELGYEGATLCEIFENMRRRGVNF